MPDVKSLGDVDGAEVQADGLSLALLACTPASVGGEHAFQRPPGEILPQLPAITYWLMGSFNGARSEDILFAAIPMAIGLVPIFILRWRINILSLGDDEAQTLGINAKRLRIIIIVCSALITAASVAVSSIIGWVGLVIPHMARRVVGNDYKKLIPATMLFGAIFMLLVDNICRNVWATDLPIGILTSFVGAPFFIYLILKEGDQL